MDAVELLSGVPLFSELPTAVLEQVARSLTATRMAAGTEVMRQGEPGDSMHIVKSGRVDVDVDGEWVRTATRGDVMGELALLGSGIRNATVRTVRDTELLTLSGAVFGDLLATEPAFSGSLIRELSRRVRVGNAPRATPRPGGVIALIAGHEGLARDRVTALGRQVADHLSRWDTTRLLRADSGAASDWSGLLDRAESEHVWTVLLSDEPGAWAEFACRQADRVLAVVDAAAPVAVRPSPARSLELVLLGSAAGTAWLTGWTPRTHYRVGSGSTEDVARMARRVAGRSVGVVLSGGGARGFAHLGVLEVLRHAGIQIDRLGGTSMGAFVASLSASGADETEIRAILQREFVQRHPFRDYTWPRHSLIRAERARQLLDRVFGAEMIEEQRVSLFCISTDLVGADEVVHRRGRIASAVGKSMSLPGLAPPQRDGLRLHVDGGVLNNLPVDVMVADGEGVVIAVDVMRPFEKGEHVTTGTGDRQLPGIVDTIGRSMVLGSWRKAEAARHMAALVVAPRLDGIGMFDFARLDEIVKLGRQAAEAALAAGDIATLLA